MKDSIFSKKRILLLGSGELGKELVIESKRLGLEVIAIDRYEKAPAMQVADNSRVIDMGDKNILKNVIKEFKPDYVVPEIEALSIEALKELEDEGFNIVPNARTVEITMNRDKIRDLASKDLKIKTAKFNYIFELKQLIPESKSVLVLCITRKDACFFAPGDEADPLYGNLFRESLSAGMITIPCSFEFHKDHISWRGIKPLK